LLSHDRWFSPGTPASSTTKTGRHDIAESGVKHHKYKKIKTKSHWFSPGNLVSSTNKTDRHDIAEILLKVALNTIH
jgi:hypothetical protein